MAGNTPRYMESDAIKAFFEERKRRQLRSLSAGVPTWVGQHTRAEKGAFITSYKNSRAPLRLPAVGEQASATVGGSGGRTSPVSPADSSDTIDLNFVDFADEVGTHPASSTVGGRKPPDSPPDSPIPPPTPLSSPAGSSEPRPGGSTPEIQHLLRTHAAGVRMMQDCLRRAHAGLFTMLHLLCGPAMEEMVRPALGFRLPPHTRSLGIDARTRARRACPGQRRPPTREALTLPWFCSGLSPTGSSDRM